MHVKSESKHKTPNTARARHSNLMRRGPPPTRTPFALHGLLPPADYTEPETLSPRRGAFGLLHDDESTSAVVGRVLGSGAEAEARWKHLAGDAAACEAIRGSVVLNHVCPHIPTSPRSPTPMRGHASPIAWAPGLAIPVGTRGETLFLAARGRGSRPSTAPPSPTTPETLAETPLSGDAGQR